MASHSTKETPTTFNRINGQPKRTNGHYDPTNFATAQALIRGGYNPSRVIVPSDRHLTPNETLELCVSYWVGMPVGDVDETVGRFHAHHNPLVSFFFREWGMVVDRDLNRPITPEEA